MKLLMRIFGASLWMLMAATLVSAQVSVGLKGGLNLANDHWDDKELNEFTENMPVVYIAIPVEFQVSELLAIQLEPSFIQKGIRLKNKTAFEYEPGVMATSEMDMKTKFNFISLPVLAKGTFGSEAIKVFVVAGPEAAYALNAKTKMEMTVTNGTTETSKEAEEINFKDDEIDRFDYGLIFGGGVEAKLGPGWITLDGRYNLGLNNYINYEDADSKVYHRGIGILIGYKMPIGVR